MIIIIALIGIAILIWILGNALWLLFPIVFAGAIWLLLKTFLETGAASGYKSAISLSKLFEGYCGAASYIVILGCIVLL